MFWDPLRDDHWNFTDTAIGSLKLLYPCTTQKKKWRQTRIGLSALLRHHGPIKDSGGVHANMPCDSAGWFRIRDVMSRDRKFLGGQSFSLTSLGTPTSSLLSQMRIVNRRRASRSVLTFVARLGSHMGSSGSVLGQDTQTGSA